MRDGGSARPNRRAAQAAQTREVILRAARRQFATAGYAATSLKDIAAEAGVSVQTLYDSVGSKADLVRGLNDLIDSEGNVFEITAGVGTETDPRIVAAVPAKVTAHLLDRCGDIMRACLAGGIADPGLAPLLEEGGRRHRAGATAIAGRLAALGALSDSVTFKQAGLTLAALSDFRLAIVLLDDHGMSIAQAERWMADQAIRAVLR
jgi:AcrR family transcriptional regulator